MESDCALQVDIDTDIDKNLSSAICEQQQQQKMLYGCPSNTERFW